MENATKALIIAGSVLIAIVLISVGVSILSSTNGLATQTQSTSDAMAITAFNSQFEAYVGTNISGSSVRGLISKINASNAKTSHAISITGKNELKVINVNGHYNVDITEYDAGGYVKKINISDNVSE